MSARPVLVDLCCKAGGASVGYQRAGFDVFGIDSEPQPNYPFPFFRGDVTKLTAADLSRLALETYGRPLAAAAGSPPCKVHTSLRPFASAHHVDLIPQTRALLVSTGLPYVIENVPGAPLLNPLVLCGSEFGLSALCQDGKRRQLRRHRLFESPAFFFGAGGCGHRGQPVGVYGTGGGGVMTNGSYKATKDEAVEALGIDWMTKAELSQAIPPAYTEFLGSQLLAHLQAVAA